MTLREYDLAIMQSQFEHPEWRKGQRFFNVLHDLAPDVADEIRATAIDPFYNDDVAPLIAFLYERFE